MAMESIQAKPFVPAAAANTTNRKKDPIFEQLLAVFQGGMTGQSDQAAWTFKENSPGLSLGKKIQNLLRPPVIKKAVASQNYSSPAAVRTDKTAAAADSPMPVRQNLEVSRAQFMDMIQAVFGQTPAAGYLERPVTINTTATASLAEEFNFLVDQIVSRIKVGRAEGQTKMMLTLNRELFGRLEIFLSFQDNKVRIEFAMNPEARQMLEPHFSGLLEALANSGIDVAGLNVTVKDNYQGGGLDQQPEGKETAAEISSSTVAAREKTSVRGNAELFIKNLARTWFNLTDKVRTVETMV